MAIWLVFPFELRAWQQRRLGVELDDLPTLAAPSHEANEIVERDEARVLRRLSHAGSDEELEEGNRHPVRPHNGVIVHATKDAFEQLP